MNSNSLLASGNILSSENPSMLQEVVVETGGFDPTAQTGGGHINMVSKDGGNKLSGTAAAGLLQREHAVQQPERRAARARRDGARRYPGSSRLQRLVRRSDRAEQTLVHRRIPELGDVDYQVDNYYNQTQGTMLYTPTRAARPIRSTPIRRPTCG